MNPGARVALSSKLGEMDTSVSLGARARVGTPPRGTDMDNYLDRCPHNVYAVRVTKGGADDGRCARTSDVQPVQLRVPSGPLSDLCDIAVAGADLPQRRARVLGTVALRRRSCGIQGFETVVQCERCLARPHRIRITRVQDHVVPGDGRSTAP